MSADEAITRVRAAQEGDQEAFAWLMAHHRGLVIGICYRLTGDAQDAADLAHESFIEAYVKLPTLRYPAKFAAWLRTLTLNLCRQWYRRQKRDILELRDELPASPAEPPADDLGPARVFSGLNRLSLPHRLALVLHYLEGLSYAEVAAFLGVPVGTVMSRLHRARLDLKKAVRKLQDTEEIPMVDETGFSREVEAEIALLLELFQTPAAAAERLSVIVERSPDRLRGLIQRPASDASLVHLASLLPRLGAAGMAIVLDAYFTPGLEARRNATRVLQHFVSRSRSECHGVGVDTRGRVGLGDMPSFDLYLLLDRLISRSPAPADMAALLIELMDSVEDLPTGQLLSEMALCVPDAAFDLLLQRFWAIPRPEDVYRRGNWVVQALRDTGTRFLRELTNTLERGETHRAALALAGMDDLARGVCDFLQRGECPSVPGARFLNETTDPALVSLVHLDDQAIAAATDQAVRFLSHPDTLLRATAIRVLERLDGRQHAPAMRACLADRDPSVRIRAVHALAELRDGESEGLLLDMATGATAAERRAAVEALGRLRASAAATLCTALIQDPDAQVRRAAVIALGELGRDAAREPLLRLLASSDPVLRKAASSALYGLDRSAARGSGTPGRPGPRFGGPGLPPGATRRVHFISPDAAIRALPGLQAYGEREITERVALVCGDWSSTRRALVEHRLLRRPDGIYQFTDLGQAVWRVEHFIMAHYLRAST